ncbi:MAG TPA: hypothetical protein VE057_07405, partial [Archangium sp.]|nr:hypothetical protein [Archangium sp.]
GGGGRAPGGTAGAPGEEGGRAVTGTPGVAGAPGAAGRTPEDTAGTVAVGRAGGWAGAPLTEGRTGAAAGVEPGGGGGRAGGMAGAVAAAGPVLEPGAAGWLVAGGVGGFPAPFWGGWDIVLVYLPRLVATAGRSAPCPAR